MKTICFNHRGSTGGGGPVTFIYKTAAELQKRGHRVTYDKPQLADAAICIIETGKFRRYCKDSSTKILLRIDGIYNAEYNQKFNRPIRPDMIALHNKLASDIPAVHHVVYQSNWSKERIDEEICKREDGNWSVIHNGVNTRLFTPVKRNPDGFINLMHLGKMRDSYIMESLVGVYDELKSRGHKVALILAGTMDGHCSKVLGKYSSDKNVRYLGSKPNTKLTQVYGHGDIFIGPRQGSSSDNVIAEAQSCGLPVVIPSWGGNVDMVKDGKTGMVVPTGHWDYGTEYIQKLSDGVEKIIDTGIEQMGLSARKHAVRELSVEKMVDKYLKALGES